MRGNSASGVCIGVGEWYYGCVWGVEGCRRGGK